MGDKTKIGWTDATWNPVTGCNKISPGCKHCYAEQVAQRFWSGRKFTDIQMHDDHRLTQPLRWKRPRMVFVNSMSDLFHMAVPEDFIDRVYAVMVLSQRHFFQVLTKREKRLAEYWELPRTRMESILNAAVEISGKKFSVDEYLGLASAPLPNVIHCVSVENQDYANQRIPVLLSVWSALRGVSIEPILGPVDLRKIRNEAVLGPYEFDALSGVERGTITRDVRYGRNKLDWVIVGGESGDERRPSEVGWYCHIATECVKFNVPVFIKQDTTRRSGQQGRIPDGIWALKQFPKGMPEGIATCA